MSRCIVPYGIRFQEDGRLETFPVVELVLSGTRQKKMRAIFHIDSGATISILPASDATWLGISLKQGKKMLVRGVIGEPSMGLYRLLTIEFNTLTFKLPVIFVAHDSIPRILGREGVFEKFAIIFDEAKRRTAFWDTQKERLHIDRFFE